MAPRGRSEREYKEKAKGRISDLLEEQPFMLRRSIQLLLEEYGIYHTITAHAIEELENEGRIRTAKYPKRGSYPIWVYRKDLRLNDIKNKISEEYLPIHKEFSDVSDKMGQYAEVIVEEALKKAGFLIVSRESGTRYFDGRTYPKKNDLDFIALHDNIFYGIELKNKISYPKFSQLMKKKDIADFHNIQFVLITRKSGRNGYRLFQEGGIHVEYGYCICNPEFSRIAEKIKEKLHYPLECFSSAPADLIEKIKKVPEWHDRHFPEKGRKI